LARILGTTGTSLADVYEVDGSIVDIDNLLSRDVNLVHDLGATMWAERVSQRLVQFTVAGVLQSADFGEVIFALPNTPARILAMTVFVDTASRLVRCAVSLRNNTLSASVEQPIWAWDEATEFTIRMAIGAGGVDLLTLLSKQEVDRIPLTRLGEDSPESMESLVVRGTTTGFGAGTLDITVNTLIEFAGLSGVSSHGVPLPGW